ncbi:PucR family transcriptional regulator [Streptomyces sp. CNZ287]|uniref:PucR family transcriptional regulator ligand-binding domain-containing protein n=1 Tax=Streptomyces sp. B22F1 TaxID=3153566 RepID=UPI00119960D4
MLTISALAALPRLGLAVLVPGPPGVLDAEIAWLHNTELPDPSGYVGRTELVLTNGLWLPTTPPDEFVDHCLAAGAAGIVFGLRDATPHTPAALTDACRAAGLPLLQLPIDVPFTAVTQAASDIRATEQQTPLAVTLRRGTAFTDALSAGAGAEGVLRVLRREFELPLAVVDRTGAVLAHSADAAPGADDAHIAATALTRTPPPMELAIADGATATLLPVGALGHPEAALLCLRPAAGLTEPQQQALSQAAHYLAMEIARRQAVRASEERFASELVDMVVSGVESPVTLTRRLVAFGIDPAQPLAALAVTSRAGVPVTDLAAATRTTLQDQGIPAVVAAGHADVVAVCTWRRPAEALPAWCRQVTGADLARERRPPLLPDGSVVGVGGPVTSPGHLRTAVLEARRASAVLAQTSRHLTVARLTDLPTYHTLLSRADPQTLHQLTAVLGALRDYDAAHEGRLENTLRTFLEHQASPSAAARVMHLHINSLYKRLARITELTGRDTATLTGRLDLLLALEADALTAP